MVRKCGIYALKYNGAYNAPFVALDNNQAMSIVKEACNGTIPDGYSVDRLGTLDFFEGIIDTEKISVFVDDGGDETDEISTSV